MDDTVHHVGSCMLQLSHSSLSNVVTFCNFFQTIPYFPYQTPLMLVCQFLDDARLPSNFRVSAKANLTLRRWELLA